MAMMAFRRVRQPYEVEDELFRVQCRVLDLGTDTALAAKELRAKLMELRQEIIDFRERSIVG